MTIDEPMDADQIDNVMMMHIVKKLEKLRVAASSRCTGDQMSTLKN